MRRATVLCGIVTLVLTLPAWGKKHESKYQSIEVKHFGQTGGMQLPPDFLDLLYAEIRNQAKKTDLFEDVLSEGEVVDVATADKSLVVEGMVVKFTRGASTKKALIAGPLVGFHQDLTANVTVQRRSDGATILRKEVTVKAPATSDSGVLAKRLGPESLAQQLAVKIVQDLKGRI